MQSSHRVARLKRKLGVREEPAAPARVRAVGYIRVSTGLQVDGYGLEVQEDSIRAFSKSQGYELLQVIRDGGVSGAMAPIERPGFQDVMKLAELGTFTVLLLYKFDRLARDVLHAITTVHMLRDRHAIAIRSVTEPIDTATPMGEMIFTVLASMAAQERRTITERTWGGRKQKAKEGGYACGGLPLGYDVDDNKNLVINESEAVTVRRIFALRREGLTFKRIADTLNAEGLVTKRGNSWRPGGVAHVLDNPTYRGQVEYLFAGFGSQEHVLRDGAHEAIVTPVTA
jgi:site-specific DNA recombinase